MRRVAVFAGAFDPIHEGHISVLNAVMSLGKTDEIILLPSTAPPYRKPVIQAKPLRELCKTAIRDLTGVRLADEKPLKSGQSIIEAIKAIKAKSGETEYLYIVGADKLAGLLHWSKVPKLFRLCRFLVYPRAGYEAGEIIRFASTHGLKAELLDMPEVNISSAMVREELNKLSDAPGMLDRETARLIALQGLYQTPYAVMMKPYVSQRRYAHTLGVRDLAVELAYEHGLPMQAAAAAALLHDCAKEMKLGMMQAMADHYQLCEYPGEMESNALLHGKIAAVFAARKYNVHDPDVLNAIRYHTTGRPGMSPLELCVFVADKAEKGRKSYPGLDEIRLLMHRDLEAAALLSMRSTRKYVAMMGQAYSEETDAAINYLEHDRLLSR